MTTHDPKRYERVCLVGNGPSTAGMGAEIDSWPLVVRMNKWKLQSAADAGEKISALAWFGGGTHLNLTRAKAEFADMRGVPLEHWFTLPPSACKPRGMGWPRCAVAMADGLPVHYITEAQWQRESRHIRSVLERLVGGHPGVKGWSPTTGFTAISLAIACGVKHLFLVGFDATLPRNAGWHDARAKWHKRGHGHIAEKYLIRELCDNKLWLGKRVDVTTRWETLPEVSTVVRGLKLKPGTKPRVKGKRGVAANAVLLRDQHVVWFRIPKCAGTSMCRAFRAAKFRILELPFPAGNNGQTLRDGRFACGGTTRPHLEAWAEDFPRLQHFRTAAFVRHPLARFVSGMRYAILRGWLPKDMQLTDAINTAFDHPDDIRIAVHAMVPQSWMLQPIAGKSVDFVGKFENLDADWARFCGWVGIRRLRLRHFNDRGPTPAWQEAIPSAALPRLIAHFKDDFEMFGYPFPSGVVQDAGPGRAYVVPYGVCELPSSVYALPHVNPRRLVRRTRSPSRAVSRKATGMRRLRPPAHALKRKRRR